VAQYLAEKSAREEAYEKEKARLKREEEIRKAKQGAVQQRAADEKAERDALRAQRIQDAAERAWRQKEKEEAERKSKAIQELLDGRAQQLAVKDRTLAQEALRERNEFLKVLEKQQREIEKQKEEEFRYSKKKQEFACDLREQIDEKTKLMVDEQKQKFIDGEKTRDGYKKQEQELKEVLEKKKVELRNMNLPDRLVKDLERRFEVARKPKIF